MTKKTSLANCEKKSRLKGSFVLVGTYRDAMMKKWILPKGYYNYPIGEEDDCSSDHCRQIKELWLYNGKRERKVFAAEFLGVKTRNELPYYPVTKEKPHGNKYLLFKVSELYGPQLENAQVHVRVSDFAKRTPKISAAMKAFRLGNTADAKSEERLQSLGAAGILAEVLPAELVETGDRLCVREEALQLDLFDPLPEMKFVKTSATAGDILSIGTLPKLVYENKDALEFMEGLSTGSVQLVLTSPPYNVGKEYEARTSIEKYLEWIRPIIEQICRVVSDTGSVCWQVGNYINDGEVFPLDIYFYKMFKDCGMQLRNRVIWHFGHGLHCKNRFSGRYETILWFSKTKDYVFNLDDVRIPSKYPGKRFYKGNKKGQLSGNPLGKNPEDVWTLQKVADDWDRLIWDIPNVKSNHPEKVDHPCQFPIELVERCVLALTNKGDVVYDPFAGVGSTMIGALKNGRVAYGTELERKYIDIGKKRIRALAKGELKVRPITQEIFAADKAGSLSKIPEEWLKKGYK